MRMRAMAQRRLAAAGPLTVRGLRKQQDRRMSRQQQADRQHPRENPKHLLQSSAKRYDAYDSKCPHPPPTFNPPSKNSASSPRRPTSPPPPTSKAWPITTASAPRPNPVPMPSG